jgi:hypothetical protein
VFNLEPWADRPAVQHALDIRLRLHIDQAEIRPGETPRDTAQRLLREVMTVDDEVLDIRVFS